MGCSPTTVSSVFSSTRLPSWGLLELLVEAMGGEVPVFRELWRAAGSPDHAIVATPTPIAGRREELAVVRRHLAQGAGRLLLVTGEAGIGKTRVVTAEHLFPDEVFMARGSCLPLSTEVPLLPVADALRAVHDRDQGQSLRNALAACPTYVPAAIARILPEIESLVTEPRAGGGTWERAQLFAAIRAILTALGDQGRFVVVIEDLHWGDSATLDLLDHLLTTPGGPGLPVVGTYRTDDPATTPTVAEWVLRMQRLPAVEVLELSALSREETADQLALLCQHAPSLELVDRIHRLAGGHPLFTEQLAAQRDDPGTGDAPLPRRLADLLDQRLEGISEGAWPVARALGVAARALTDTQLSEVTGLAGEDLRVRLRDLDRRRLLARADGHDVELRHPLLGAAIRRRLVTGEAAYVHRRLAMTLATAPDRSAAEVAEHWQRAEVPEQELVWRISAARAAGRRFALAQEAEQWRRALDIWPVGVAAAGSPAIHKSDAYLAAMDALEDIDVAGAWTVAQDAMRTLADPASTDAAETYQRAAQFQGNLGDPEGALALLGKAIRIYESSAPSAGYVHALARREWFQSGLGRDDEGAATAALAVEVSARLGETAMYRSRLSALATYDAMAGDLDLALSRSEAAASIELAEPDPTGEIHLAGNHTVILLMAAAGPDEVVAAARPGLEAAAAWGLDTFPLSVLRANVARALRLAGQVHRAAELIDPMTQDTPTYNGSAEHCERADIDVLRGRLDAASERFEALSTIPIDSLFNLAEFVEDAAVADLWGGRPRAALDRLLAALEDSLTTDASAHVGALLVLAARAAADFEDSPLDAPGTRREVLARLDGLLSRAKIDPFEPRPAFAARPALAATWAAEMARLAGESSLEHWAAAASAWDRLPRPHDSAYCRWRAAQVALSTGRASAATRLLRRAARDAGEHVPLLAAIRETSQPGRWQT